MVDADFLLTNLVARVRALPSRPIPDVRILAYDERLAIIVEEVLTNAGGTCLTLTLPDDLDDALSLIENVLPGADVLVIVAPERAPVRQALDVIAELVPATGLFEPGGDAAWGLLSGVPLVIVPSDRYEAVVAAHVVAVPALRARAGEAEPFATPRPVRVSSSVPGVARARRFVPGRSSLVDQTLVAPMPEARSLDAADVLLVIPDSADVREGDTVAALPLRGHW